MIIITSLNEALHMLQLLPKFFTRELIRPFLGRLCCRLYRSVASLGLWGGDRAWRRGRVLFGLSDGGLGVNFGVKIVNADAFNLSHFCESLTAGVIQG